MVKRKISFWYIITFILLIFLFLGAFKTLNNHQEKEYLVVNKKILEAARKCYLNKECDGDITLKILYEKKYLDILIDPVTKENMKDDLCISFKDNNAMFCDQSNFRYKKN